MDCVNACVIGLMRLVVESAHLSSSAMQELVHIIFILSIYSNPSFLLWSKVLNQLKNTVKKLKHGLRANVSGLIILAWKCALSVIKINLSLMPSFITLLRISGREYMDGQTLSFILHWWGTFLYWTTSLRIEDIIWSLNCAAIWCFDLWFLTKKPIDYSLHCICMCPMLGAMIAPVLISVTLSPSGPPVCHNLTYYIVRLYCVPIQILDQSWIIRRTQWRKTQSLIFIPWTQPYVR